MNLAGSVAVMIARGSRGRIRAVAAVTEGASAARWAAMVAGIHAERRSSCVQLSRWSSLSSAAAMVMETG